MSDIPIFSFCRFKKPEEFGARMRQGLLFERTWNEISLPWMDTQVSIHGRLILWNVLSTQWAAAPGSEFWPGSQYHAQIQI